jgi:hypothetical protein
VTVRLTFNLSGSAGSGKALLGGWATAVVHVDRPAELDAVGFVVPMTGENGALVVADGVEMNRFAGRKAMSRQRRASAIAATE